MRWVRWKDAMTACDWDASRVERMAGDWVLPKVVWLDDSSVDSRAD
jgi:hypothetical protein